MIIVRSARDYGLRFLHALTDDIRMSGLVIILFLSIREELTTLGTSNLLAINATQASAMEGLPKVGLSVYQQNDGVF